MAYMYLTCVTHLEAAMYLKSTRRCCWCTDADREYAVSRKDGTSFDEMGAEIERMH